MAACSDENKSDEHRYDDRSLPLLFHGSAESSVEISGLSHTQRGVDLADSFHDDAKVERRDASTLVEAIVFVIVQQFGFGSVSRA
jgi:hypothetical protein